MTLNLADFEQRGPAGYWYRAGRKSAAHVLRPCEGCGQPCLVRAGPPPGRFCSRSCALTGERHPAWKGNDAGYCAAHDRVYRARGKAASCVWGCQASAYEWASMTGDLLDPDDYASMCVSCHQRFDAAVRITETRPARWRWRPWRSNRKPEGDRR